MLFYVCSYSYKWLLINPLQLSQRAREIYNSFLSSKATTPVNIDSQAQLADDILNAPRPDMFKEQQLQVTLTLNTALSFTFQCDTRQTVLHNRHLWSLQSELPYEEEAKKASPEGHVYY